MNKISKINLQTIIISGTVSTMATLVLQRVYLTFTDPIINLVGTIGVLLAFMLVLYYVLESYLCYEPLIAKFRLDGNNLIGEYNSHPKRKVTIVELNYQASIQTGEIVDRMNLLLNVEIEVTKVPKETIVHAFRSDIIQNTNIITFVIIYYEESENEAKTLRGSVRTLKSRLDTK
jgi:hypothetical protein